ncbi:MAG TPA: SRPBCC domain-containing protein, partial [Bryobacteraceae bacterium]|nr:SRPBCC domain-containing protein [Bryobacteraceae bacterium]
PSIRLALFLLTVPALVSAQPANPPPCIGKANPSQIKAYVMLIRLRGDLYSKWKATGSWPNDEQANQALDAHSKYWDAQLKAGRAILAGGMNGDYWDNAALIIFEASSQEEAESMVKNDPAVKRYVFQAQVRPFDVQFLTNKFTPGAKPCSPAPTAMNPVTVTRIDRPEKALKFEVVVPGSVDQVWRAFTTQEGLQEWLWRDVTVDLREGGDWMVHFPGGSTGGGTIVSFELKRSITIRALAPERFPEVRRERTTAVFRFEPMEAGTKVTLLQTGWKTGKEWDEAYGYLADGNAQLLNQLLTRFKNGPIVWK